MKVLVLGGGTSTERDVSLRSAAAVNEALQQAGFETLQADPRDGLSILDGLHDTLVFPILHGKGGEDGVIQRELESRSLPYLGTTSSASEICFDKAKTKSEYQKAGLPIAKGQTVTKATYSESEIAKIPHALKATQGGSSIGTYLVHDPAQIDQAKVEEVFSLCEEAVVEELVDGVEITVPILDTIALPVIEIQSPQGQEFDYTNKYNGTTKELCPPVSIDADTQQRAQQLGLQAHQVLGCRHLSRTDMIVRPDGSIVLLETNTMPGMTDQSLYPKSASASGMSFPELMTTFVKLVKSDQD